MTVSVNITGLDPIAAAINSLAQAMGARGVTTAIAEAPTAAPQPVQTAASQPAVQTAVPPTVPVAQAPSPVAAQVTPPPAAVPPVAPPPVQTAAVAYTQDDLARAAVALIDSGRQGDLRGLLAQFGVDSLPHLPAAQYGAFATALRGMGAQI